MPNEKLYAPQASVFISFIGVIGVPKKKDEPKMRLTLPSNKK